MAVAMESKVTVGSETETVGVMEKSEMMVGLEVETVAGTESGVNMEVGTDLKSVVGAEVGVGSVMVSAAADVGAETGLIVVGTDTRDDLVVVAGVEACTSVEMIPSACVAVSEFLAPANVQLRIVGMGMEMPE